MDSKLIDKLIEQQETIKIMQENEDNCLKIMKMYEECRKRINKALEKLNIELAYTSSYQLNYQTAMYIIEETKKILKGEEK